nr:hypothetical protein [Tanacetum cinerariifolium]
MGEHVTTSPTKKKKRTRNCQKRTIQTDDGPQQIAWTTEEEIALAKGWSAISENSQHGNPMKKGEWVRGRDYVQKTMIHYQAETGLPFKFRHCWDVLKDGLKFKEIAFSNFNQRSGGSSKRHKSSASSSFNTESMDASINLNITVVDEDEVQEIRRRRGRDKARAAAKNKGSKPSGSSTMNDNALAKLVVNEMIGVEVQQRKAFIEIKMRKVECRE